jgi:hypothetical protein
MDVANRHKALRARKLKRDTKILERELEDRSNDPFVLFNPGGDRRRGGREWREALDFLRRSLAGSAPTDSIVRKLFALIARGHQMMDTPSPSRVMPDGSGTVVATMISGML